MSPFFRVFLHQLLSFCSEAQRRFGIRFVSIHFYYQLRQAMVEWATEVRGPQKSHEVLAEPFRGVW